MIFHYSSVSQYISKPSIFLQYFYINFMKKKVLWIIYIKQSICTFYHQYLQMEKQSKKSETNIVPITQNAKNVPIKEGSMTFQQLLLKHFQDYKSCHPFTRENFETETKEIVNLIISNKTSPQQLNSAQKFLNEKYSVDSLQQLKDLAEQRFRLINAYLNYFLNVSISTDEGYNDIKQASLEVYDLIILAAVRQKSLSAKSLTFEECSAIVQKAKIDYKIESSRQFQKVLIRAMQNQQKWKNVYQKINQLDQLQQTNNKIQQIKQILQIFKIYRQKKGQLQETEMITQQEESLETPQPKKVKINFKILQNPTKKMIQCTMNDTAQQLLKILGLKDEKNVKVYIYSRQEEKYIEFQQNNRINELLQEYDNFNGLVKKMLQVTFEGKIYCFAKYTSLNEITSKIGQKSKDYGFWKKDFKEEIQKQLIVDLCMRPICKNINLFFDDLNMKNIVLPSDTPIKQLLKYIDLKQLCFDDKDEGRKELILNQQTQLLFRSMNVNGKIINLEQHQQSSILSITKANIQSIYLTFKCHLEISFKSSKNTTQISLEAYGDSKISQLKSQIQEKTKLQHQKQNWSIQSEELSNQDTLFSKKIYESHLRVNVTQVQNLQYYGFSKIIKIEPRLFFDYSIQDDDKFIRQLKNSDFPAQAYETSFRVSCLRNIFTAMKKYCSIETAQAYIKQLNKKVKLNSQIKNIQKDKLWLSQIMSQISLFSAGYLLHHLLLCSQQQLRTAIMNGYKGQSPIFYKTFNEKGEKESYEDQHFWLSNKSLYITSIQITDDNLKRSVKGKSNALNLIFDTNFEISLRRHPLCSKSISIAYNVYRNEDLPVNIIDVSSNSCSEEEKIELCKVSNMIIIHYFKEQKEAVDKWMNKNCSNKLCILLQRDNNIVINNTNLFAQQLKNNQSSRKRKTYSIPQLTQQYMHYFQNKIPDIVNQIHIFIQQSVLKPQTSNNLWSFPLSLAKKSQQKQKIIEILKLVQQDFEKIVNLNLLSKQIKNITQSDLQRELLTPITRRILDFADQGKYSKYFFRMLRDYIRGLRSQRLKSFHQLHKLLKIFKNKQQVLKAQNYNKIKQLINSLQSIPQRQKTKQFNHILSEISKIKISQEQFEQLQKKIQRLNMIFQSDIKQREFSIQNFWRGLTILFHANIQVPQKIIPYKQKAKSVFNSDFKGGNFFQIINGESMQIPINLIKSLQPIILNKKITVVGVFGPQSSGKSTLLNYLFGCDFASSDGRCTSGVYGTYYQISGGTLAYDGVLILDTEGLFSNFERKNSKACNFDNKLVLFLISICDVVILNTRGDVDVRCEEILEVSYDSQLMAHQKGKIYPHFYIVLNHTANIMAENQFQQVVRLIDKIKAVQPQMQNYMNGDQADTLPLAFNINDKTNGFEVLKRIQLKSKTPTDQFYTKTKQLSIRLINTFNKRNPRLLIQVFDQINANWRSIINNPNLTMFKSKFLKEQDRNISIQSGQRAKIKSQIINRWLKEMPLGLVSLQQYVNKKGLQFEKLLQQAKRQFQNQNPQGSNSDINQTVKKYEHWLVDNLRNSYQSFKIRIDQKLKQLQFIQFQERGLFSLNQQARRLKKLKRENVNIQGQKNQIFDKVWQSHVQTVTQYNYCKNVAARKFKETKQLFQISLKEMGIKTDLNYNQQDYISTQIKSIEDYSKFLIKKIQQQNENNKNFLQYFQTLNMDPIIILEEKSQSSIKGNYLRMSQFFEHKKQLIDYYLSQQPLKMINYTEIYKKYLTQMVKYKYINDYLKFVEDDLSSILVKIANRGQFQEEILKNIYLILKGNKNIQCLKLTQDMLVIASQKNVLTGGDGWFFKNTRGFLKQCQYESKYFSQKHNRFQYKKPKNCKLNILWSQEAMEAIQKQFQKYSQKAKAFQMIKNIIFYSLLQYVQKYKKQIKEEILSTNLQISALITNAFQIIGLKIANNQPLAFSLSQGRIFIESGGFEAKVAPTIKRKNYEQLLQMINELPYFCNIDMIKKCITNRKNKNSFRIGQAYSIIMGIKQKYRNSHKKNNNIIKILQNYLNKDYAQVASIFKTPQFKSTIFPFINKFAFVDKIVNFLQNQFDSHSQIELNLRQIINIIGCQIKDFKQDLKQISHCLSQNFIVQIYNIAACLLSKKYQLIEIINAKQSLLKLDQQEKKQKSNFMSFLEGNENESIDSANFFVQQYQKYLIKMIHQRKNSQLDTKKAQFLNKNNRILFQQGVEDKLLLTKDQQTAYQYLTKQKDYLLKEYNQLIKHEVNSKLSSQVKFDVDSHIQQLRTFTQKQLDYVLSTSNQDDQQTQNNWQSIHIFTQNHGKQKDNILLGQIFLALLKGQKAAIDKNYRDNYFNLNPNSSIRFENKQFFKQKINLDFIKSFGDRNLQFQISNYFLFLKEMIKSINQLKQKLKKQMLFSQEEKNKHKSKLNLQFCGHQCHFCGRFCQIDLKDHANKKHKCFSGHQLRALKGITIEMKQGGKATNYGSVHRCDQMKDNLRFVFNSIEKSWGQHKKQVEDWDFTNNRENSSQGLFNNLWNLAGPKICCQKKLQKKQQFKFITIDDFKRKNESVKFQNNHFVFAIDGSSSMESNNNWDNQLQQIKQYLKTLLGNHKNIFSLIVWTTKHTNTYVRSPLTDFDINKVPFIQGGTSPCQGFKGALSAIGSMLNENIYFIYTSDGDGEYPDAQVKLMIEKKKIVQTNGFKFVTMAVKIGSEGTEELINRIATDLGGKSEFVSSAAELGIKMREIMKT